MVDFETFGFNSNKWWSKWMQKQTKEVFPISDLVPSWRPQIWMNWITFLLLINNMKKENTWLKMFFTRKQNRSEHFWIKLTFPLPTAHQVQEKNFPDDIINNKVTDIWCVNHCEIKNKAYTVKKLSLVGLPWQSSG